MIRQEDVARANRRRKLQLTALWVAAALALCGAIIGGLPGEDSALPTGAVLDREHRGEQLVKLGGCADCHTPVAYDAELGMPAPRVDRALSGHPQDAPDPVSSLDGADQAVIGATSTSFRVPFGVVY